ncbi:PilZ domain-containing protein [Christensenellaceae bacterium OttesenSCG-928-K19]|nr:PilZ domain-containing protein [Christensenellaceae bacterium OttesenSCG-928-K19]
MTIKNIKDNTVLQVVSEENNTVHRATFYEPYKNDCFFAKSKSLHSEAAKNIGKRCRVSFYNEDCICTFLSEIQRVFIKSGSYLTLLCQVSGIEETSQRKFQREDIATKVNLYGLSEENFQKSIFARDRILFSSMSMNISAGGMCLVSNEQLRPSPDPYYLTEFSINKEAFLLPAHLLRRSDAPRFMQYRYSYGFGFLCENIPADQNRLLGTLINTKASAGTNL